MATVNAGLLLESAATAQAYKDGVSEFKNNLVQASANQFAVEAAAAAVITAADLKTMAESQGCIAYTDYNAIGLTNPLYSTNPNFLPKAGSPALAGADFTGLPTFFTATAYRGAFGTTNWASGWTNFDPQNTAY